MAVRLGAVAARDRDVELGIAPHAVLGDVQAGRLHMPLDADAPEALERPEAAERSPEREDADGDQPERLHAELVEGASVDEPARTSVQIGGEGRDRKEAGRERAP